MLSRVARSIMGFGFMMMAYLYFSEDEEFLSMVGQPPQRAASTQAGAAIVAAVGCMDRGSPAFMLSSTVPCSGPNGCYTDLTEEQLTELGCCNPRDEGCEQPDGNRCPTQTSLDNGVLTPCNNGCCTEPDPPTCADIHADGTNVVFDCGAHTHGLAATPEAVACARGTTCAVDRCCTVAPPERRTADECPEGILRGQVALARPMSSYIGLDPCWVYIDLPDGESEPNGRMDADEPRAQLDDDGSYALDLITCQALEFVRDLQNGTNAIRLRSGTDPTPCDPSVDGCRRNLECDEGGTASLSQSHSLTNQRLVT